MDKKKRALILVDHGSVVKEANEMLIEVTKMLKNNIKCNFDIICYSHMELADPTISEAFEACVAQGADEIIVHPYFLSPGRHSKQDIPNMVKEVARNHPEVSFRVTEPLGLHDKMIEVVLERANN
ncbi:cobalamin biosynthesis protein CbiX [Desulfobacterota bacterium AH_259_B03_O07]|nr:cobalamin biosynthesis protein CbiX [Desulfobacterota bacterium AH_259_B03_O07]